MKRLVSLLVFALPCAAQFAPTPCFTALGPCASEATSTAQKAELILQKAELVLHTARMTAILADAIKNSVKQGGLPGSNLQVELASVAGVLQAGAALNQATASLSLQWDRTFPRPTAVYAPGTPGFHQDYAKWSGAAMDSLRVAMFAGKVSHDQQQSVAGVITQLEGILAVVDGRLRAQMATAAATTRTAASIERLNQTMMTGNSAAQVWMAYQLQKDMQQHASEQTFFTPMDAGRDNKGY